MIGPDQDEPAGATAKPGRRRTAKRGHHHGDLRAVLMEAALGHVRASGAATFSLRDATSAAGVTSGAAYRHFRSRAELLDEVVVIGFERLSRAMHEAALGEGGAARIAATGKAYVGFAASEPHLFALMFSPEGEEGRARSFRSDFGVPNAAEQLRAALRAAGARDEHAETQAWGLAHGLAGLVSAGIGMPAASIDRAIEAFAEAITGTIIEG